MATRAVTALCRVCDEPITDDHANYPGTIGAGARWRHDDQEAFIRRGLDGDSHPAQPGTIIDSYEFETAAEEKQRKADEARKKRGRGQSEPN